MVGNICANFTFLFMEAKKPNATLKEIDEIECQTFTACFSHLRYIRRPAEWAMTCILVDNYTKLSFIARKPSLQVALVCKTCPSISRMLML